MRTIQDVLVVEDDPLTMRSIVRRLRVDYDVVEATTLAEGLAALRRRFDLVVTDVQLPDGRGVEIARRAAALRPAPLVVAITGHATRAESFELAQLGVTTLLEKPFSPPELLAAIVRVAAEAPDLAVACLVGRAPMKQVVEHVRDEMTAQAVAMAKGNMTTAGKLLGVSRQAVTQAARKGAAGSKRRSKSRAPR